MVFDHHSRFSDLLKAEYFVRRNVNPRFSMRAFARSLQVDSSHLTKVLKGQLGVSDRFVEWTGRNLKWSTVKIDRAKKLPDVSRAKAGRKLFVGQETRFVPLTAEDTRVAAKWLHYIILELTHLKGFSATIANIAQRLKRDPEEITSAICDLVELGALAECGKGVFRATRQLSSIKIQGTTQDLKNMQREILSAAAQAMERYSPEERDQSGIVMAVDPSKIAEAKEKVKKFRREMMAFLEDGEKTAIYQLSISLFPVGEKQ